MCWRCSFTSCCYFSTSVGGGGIGGNGVGGNGVGGSGIGGACCSVGCIQGAGTGCSHGTGIGASARAAASSAACRCAATSLLAWTIRLSWHPRRRCGVWVSMLTAVWTVSEEPVPDAPVAPELALLSVLLPPPLLVGALPPVFLPGPHNWCGIHAADEVSGFPFVTRL